MLLLHTLYIRYVVFKNVSLFGVLFTFAVSIHGRL